MTAATLTRPVIRMTRVTPDMLAAQWERLAEAYNQGLVDDEAIWRAVDALAPNLDTQERTEWFEQLHTAVADRDGDIDLGSVPPDERDPDLLEADAIRRAEEATEALICGASPWFRYPPCFKAYLAELAAATTGGAR